MTLLYNSEVEFPIKYSTQQLPSSGKTKRRPSAWAEHHVEPEVSRAERWAPRQLGMGDMLIMPPTSAHMQRVHGCFVSEAEIRKVVEPLLRGPLIRAGSGPLSPTG